MTILWLVYSYSSNKQSNASIILIILLCISYGGLLEIMQATVFSNRSGDWLDFIANSFGCLMGLYLLPKRKEYYLNSIL